MQEYIYTKTDLKRIGNKVLKQIENGLSEGLTNENSLLNYINKNKYLIEKIGELKDGVGGCDQILYSTDAVPTNLRVTKKDVSNCDIRSISVEDANISVNMNLIPNTDIVENVEVDISVYCKIVDAYGYEENETVYLNIGEISAA